MTYGSICDHCQERVPNDDVCITSTRHEFDEHDRVIGASSSPDLQWCNDCIKGEFGDRWYIGQVIRTKGTFLRVPGPWTPDAEQMHGWFVEWLEIVDADDDTINDEPLPMDVPADRYLPAREQLPLF